MTATWEDIKHRLSLLRKLSYWKLTWEDRAIEFTPSGEYAGDEQRTQVEQFTDATVFGSLDKQYPYHRLVLDIDHPAVLVPSSTPGHSHLIIDHLIGQTHWEALLNALADAGVIQDGYARASIHRGQSFIRAPWVGKTGNRFPPDGAETFRVARMEDGVALTPPPKLNAPTDWENYHA